eukprot:CAMPEP_0184676448 /NCGR_PEP_ID=MMETSP0308-20130426/88357_1 /TAXON_ID=38269 /ORGANISM="Gloeochaete witrockiana, Strain SAG 46.84" /LENGTH=787 /DNA_ID=CAMNT_0027124283 /DNA_START=1 /DNA_END=2360 /DNA_ORIENTATION=+
MSESVSSLMRRNVMERESTGKSYATGKDWKERCNRLEASNELLVKELLNAHHALELAQTRLQVASIDPGSLKQIHRARHPSPQDGTNYDQDRTFQGKLHRLRSRLTQSNAVLYEHLQLAHTHTLGLMSNSSISSRSAPSSSTAASHIPPPPLSSQGHFTTGALPMYPSMPKAMSEVTATPSIAPVPSGFASPHFPNYGGGTPMTADVVARLNSMPLSSALPPNMSLTLSAPPSPTSSPRLHSMSSLPGAASAYAYASAPSSTSAPESSSSNTASLAAAVASAVVSTLNSLQVSQLTPSSTIQSPSPASSFLPSHYFTSHLHEPALTSPVSNPSTLVLSPIPANTTTSGTPFSGSSPSIPSSVPSAAVSPPNAAMVPVAISPLPSAPSPGTAPALSRANLPVVIQPTIDFVQRESLQIARSTTQPFILEGESGGPARTMPERFGADLEFGSNVSLGGSSRLPTSSSATVPPSLIPRARTAAPSHRPRTPGHTKSGPVTPPSGADEQSLFPDSPSTSSSPSPGQQGDDPPEQRTPLAKLPRRTSSAPSSTTPHTPATPRNASTTPRQSLLATTTTPRVTSRPATPRVTPRSSSTTPPPPSTTPRPPSAASVTTPRQSTIAALSTPRSPIAPANRAPTKVAFGSTVHVSKSKPAPAPATTVQPPRVASKMTASIAAKSVKESPRGNRSSAPAQDSKPKAPSSQGSNTPSTSRPNSALGMTAHSASSPRSSAQQRRGSLSSAPSTSPRSLSRSPSPSPSSPRHSASKPPLSPSGRTTPAGRPTPAPAPAPA